MRRRKGKWRSGNQNTKTAKIRTGHPQTTATVALSGAKGFSSREFRMVQESLTLRAVHPKVGGQNAD
jgi:hypothetical protein